MRVGVCDLSRGEALKGKVVVGTRRDRNASEPGGAQIHEIRGSGTEDPEVVQDLRKIADRMGHPVRQ